MRAPEESSTGGIGVDEVCGLFGRIRWAALENKDRHDLGTDILVAARDPRRFDRGLLIGAQVKGGPSWFKEPEYDASGDITGWWHRNDSAHFDYWVKHTLPHLVVLYDVDARAGYWVQVTSDRCESTGKGLKIFVPKENTVSERDVPKLLDVAKAQRGSIALEGTSFDAAAIHVAPGDRLRFALLIPRLIAPHANRSEQNLLEPEEAIALLTLLHVQQVQERLKADSDWRYLNESPRCKDWRWHFAYALWRYLASHDKTLLEKVYEDAANEPKPRTDWRVAAAIALASCNFLENGSSEAYDLICQELAEDGAAPIDHAWLQLHAAHYATESGSTDLAKQHAATALSDLAIDTDDPTASLLSGVAYRIIFNLTSWQDRTNDVSSTLKAGDNAGSWWRDQQLRWALDAVALEQFRKWSRDESSRWEAEPPAQQLLPSVLMALFSADHTSWAAAESRLGRYELQADQFESGFFRLLRSGDVASLKLAGNRAFDFGPSAALSRLSTMCVPSIMLPSRADTMIAFWSEFGDVGSQDAADEVIAWCLQHLTSHPAGSVAVRTYDFSQLLETIVASLAASSEATRLLVATKFQEIPVHWTTMGAFCRLAETLEQQVPGKLDLQHILSIAHSQPAAHETAALLGLAASAGSMEARTELLSAAQSGNILATAIAFDNDLFSAETIQLSVDAVARSLAAERDDAGKGKVGLGRSVDRCRLLIALYLKFPSVADWSQVVEYLGDSRIVADHKTAACRYLVHRKLDLPPDLRDAILAQLPGLRASKYVPENLFDPSSIRELATDLADYVGLALGSSPADFFDTYISSALLGNMRQRYRAWEALSRRLPDGYDLSALQALNDEDLGIRLRCARFIALRIGSKFDNVVLRRAVKAIAEDRGVRTLTAFLSEARAEFPGWVVDLVKPLCSHVSASIRSLARELCNEAAPG